MDYLTNNWSTLCLACVGGALGYYYQYSRPVSAAELGNVYVKVVSEKVSEYLNLPDKIIGNVLDNIPSKVKHEIDDIVRNKTLLDRMMDSLERWWNYIWCDLDFSEIQRFVRRKKLFIVFSCTGFLLVYSSINEFVNRPNRSGSRTIRGGYRLGRSHTQRFLNPVELFFGYCLHQTREISETFRKDPVPSALFVATIFYLTFDHFVKVTYVPETDHFRFQYRK